MVEQLLPALPNSRMIERRVEVKKKEKKKYVCSKPIYTQHPS
jgi:hypothetical protein